QVWRRAMRAARAGWVATDGAAARLTAVRCKPAAALPRSPADAFDQEAAARELTPRGLEGLLGDGHRGLRQGVAEAGEGSIRGGVEGEDRARACDGGRSGQVGDGLHGGLEDRGIGDAGDA